MSFNPPQFPTADQSYQYGNIIWRFDGTAGVWNIVDGSLVGEQGPQGPIGPQGPQGERGNTGNPATGDTASIIVSNGFITARLGAVGTTGVLGVSNRFTVVNGIAHPLPASNGASGIASFDSTHFTVSGTGHVSLSSPPSSQATGHTVLAGIAIGVANEGGNVRRIDNIGVTSFNGLTGAVTLTGDGAALVGVGNNTVRARLADTSVTGVASFNSSFFSVNNSGAVSLASPFSIVGVTGIGFGLNDAGLTGKINLTASGIVTLARSGNTITIGGVGGGGAVAGITANPQQVLYSSGNGGTGSNNFVFDGLAATFGGQNTQFTITGPTFNIGNNTVVYGGIFYDASEAAPFTNFANSQIQIRGASGSVQRFSISPASSYTVSIDDTGGWVSTPGVAESVVVIMQSTNGRTGQFNNDILTQLPTPILGGVTGGVDVFTVMRIAYTGGNGLIKMAFPIARGMSGTNFSIGT